MPLRREEDHLEAGPTWDDLVERKIREAQARGDFDNLPGLGKPLSINRNPYAGDWELAYKILNDNGFAPPWVEASREMEHALTAVGAAEAGWHARRPGGRLPAREEHQARVEAAIRAVERFNLMVPFPWLQRFPPSLERELGRFDAAWPPDEPL